MRKNLEGLTPCKREPSSRQPHHPNQRCAIPTELSTIRIPCGSESAGGYSRLLRDHRPCRSASASLPGYARKTDNAMNPVGGKLLPDNLTTQTNVVRYPLCSRHFTFIVGANQPKAIRDCAATTPCRSASASLPGYARRAEGVANPVGGKLLPDNLTTQTNVVRYPLCSRHFTFIVGANQPEAIRDYAVNIAPCRSASASLPGYAREPNKPYYIQLRGLSVSVAGLLG